MSPRIKLVESPYRESVIRDFKAVMPEGMPPLAIFRAVANNPRVLSRMISGGLLDKGSISISARELIILRACARTGAEYEWGVHVAGFATKAGFTAKQIEHTCLNAIDPLVWSDEQKVLLMLVDELHSTNEIGEELWIALSSHFQTNQLIELVMLTGLYHAVSFIVNAFEIERESFAPAFPECRDL